MGLYRPLVVTALLEGRDLADFHPAVNMRLNLLASSNEDPRMLYVVSENIIQIYQFATLTPSGPPTLVDRLVDPRCANAGFRSKVINVIKVGYLGTDEVLVSADEKGEVCVWFTMNLSRDPLLLSVSDSAWGIDIHASRRLIAISSNAHTATVFYCGTEPRPSERRLFRDDSVDSQNLPSTGVDPGPNMPSIMTSLSARELPLQRLFQQLQQELRQQHQNLPPESHDSGSVESASQQVLRGHEHNIPSVCFSPCGHFAATASIDQTCRTWRLSDGKQIQQKSVVPLWGWGVTFIPKESWLTIRRSDYKAIPKSHLQPGKLPGQNVRDSPLWSTTNPPRRSPFGRDQRMVRTQWHAGPLHGTSCDEADSDDEPDDNDDEADGHSQYGNIAQGISNHGHGVNLRRARRMGGEFYDDDDDRDAALFGMDDDEGEEGEDSGDEWEEYLSGSEESDIGEAEEAESNDTSAESTVSGAANRASAAAIARILGTREPRTGLPHGSEYTVDTGDDGDDEQVGGMETEDGGGTTEDGRGSQRNSHSVRKPISATETEVSELGESSEYEHPSQIPSKSFPPSSSNSRHGPEQHPKSEQSQGSDGLVLSTPAPTSCVIQEQEQIEQMMTEQQLWNRDPTRFIHLSRTDQHRNTDCTNTESSTHFASVEQTSTFSSLAQKSPALPPFPTEFLAFATAKNIYLLGPNAAPARKPTTMTQVTNAGRTAAGTATGMISEDTESDGVSGEPHDPATSALPVHIVYGDHDEDDDDGSEDENDPGYATTGLESREWNAYEQDYDTDMDYDEMDYFMGDAEEESQGSDQDLTEQSMDDMDEDEEGEGDEGSDEESDGDDGDIDLHFDGEDSSGSERRRMDRIRETLGTFFSSQNGIAPLYDVSIARSAVDRADGRRSRHLEHFDRLFVMQVIPELSVLIAASQKGAVTVFRLLKVVDDPVSPTEKSKEIHEHTHRPAVSKSQRRESGELGIEEPLSKKRSKSNSMAGPASGTSSRSNVEEVSRGGSSSRRHPDSRQVSEPRQQIPQEENAPPTEAESTATSTMNEGEHYVLFPEVYLPRHDLRIMPLLGVSAVAIQNYHRPKPREGGGDGDGRSAMGPMRASSFVVHLAYLDGQLFSYEIQLRSDKRDPVPMFNLFV